MMHHQTGLSRRPERVASALFLILFPLIALLSAKEVQGHPAHAKPVNYPFVIGFERFHSSLDDEDYLAEGGFILLNELNCVACHAPPKHLDKQLEGVEATYLSGIANRLDPVSLELMIRNPRFLKRDTMMPSLFAGPDRDLSEVEALKHYLASLSEPVPDYPVGDIEAGRSFYHSVGCVACHAPEVGYRPEGIPENAEIELSGLPSVAMNLADLYHLDALTHFLLKPHEHRPSGRMPDFKLSEKEAVDLAAYLRAGPDLILPENLTNALAEGASMKPDEALIAKGKALFRSKQCHACHSIPDEAGNALAKPQAMPLADINPDVIGGCFSERPPGGAIPFYGLDEVQKRAISAALRRLESRKEFDLKGEVDWRMKRLNCYACHERGGVGGAEMAREVYFGFSSKEALALGRWGNLPPSLDGVGAKLTPNWMERVFLGVNGGGAVRPYMVARMPLFGHEDVKPFLQQFRKLDELPKGPRLGGKKGTPDEGKAVFESAEMNCRSCHGAGAIESSGAPGINLAFGPERLERDWFEQFLLHPQAVQRDTPMPDLFDETPEGRRAIQSLWEYLKEIGSK
ncbi:MAG: c-type cytochrome [Verrucomicrobiales bacterium]|nr:c-type cytochrome [Verrucomicrobiales bacterium]